MEFLTMYWSEIALIVVTAAGSYRARFLGIYLNIWVYTRILRYEYHLKQIYDKAI